MEAESTARPMVFSPLSTYLPCAREQHDKKAKIHDARIG